MSVLAWVFALIAAVTCAVTAARTADAYGSLPSQVPIHFGLRGAPDSYGPRPMIFTVVAVQLLMTGLSVAASMLMPARAALFQGFMADVVVIGLAWLQNGVVSVAQGRTQRIAHVWRFIVLIVAGSVVAAVGFHHFPA